MARNYDLAIIGMGAAGLTAAPFAVRLGAKGAAIDNGRIGGDCTWTGCVPSKTLIKAARLVHQMRTAERFGLDAVELKVDYGGLRDHIRQVIDVIYQPTSPDSLREKGMDVFTGTPRFRDAHTIEIDGAEITAGKTIICTGAVPSIPTIEGLADVDYQTYLDIWDKGALPRHLIVIGAGPIGRELAQAFRRLGTNVTLLEAAGSIGDDPDVSEVLMAAFRAEGMDVRTGASVQRVREDAQGIHVMVGDEGLTCDTLLVATGRRPNVEGLGLENAGVRFSHKGIQISSRLRTTHPDIYAAGDCTGGMQFSHYAGWQGFMAARNALLPVSTRGTSDFVPWCIFTDPEVAHVGLTDAQSREKYGDDVVTNRWPMGKVDRALNEGEPTGFLKLVYRKNGTILGVTIVAAQAGEMINEWVVAMREGFKIDGLARSIHAYPTYSMATLQATAAISVDRALSGVSGGFIRRIARVAHRGGLSD